MQTFTPRNPWASWPGARVRARARGAARQLGWLLLVAGVLALFNAFVHPPAVGYDAGDHIAYYETLAQRRLPTPTDSSEFFSPPLPYLLPALSMALGADWHSAGKIAQLAQAGLLLLALWQVGQVAAQLAPGDTRLRLTATALVAALPVLYKSFAFVRGEPYVLLCTLLFVGDLLRWLAPVRAGRLPAFDRRALRLALWLGLALLARQWAFFVALAALLVCLSPLWRHWRAGRPVAHYVRAGAAIGALTLLVGGWFYAHLVLRYGSITAFNRAPAAALTLANHPPDFYRALGWPTLFSDPVRPNLARTLWPKLYAETWGDNEAYFLVRGVQQTDGRVLFGIFLEQALAAGAPVVTNRAALARHLGWVNVAALLPTALLLTGWVAALPALGRWLRGTLRADDLGRALLALIVLCGALGYFWFLVQYPNPVKSDTVKATYILHLFPPLALLAGGWLTQLAARWPRAAHWLWLTLVLCLLLIVPAGVTRY